MRQKSAEEVLIHYAMIASKIKECNQVIRSTFCVKSRNPDYECGDQGAPSCLTLFFETVKEARFTPPGMDYDQARAEALEDTVLCDVCKARLAALETRRTLKPKIRGAIRSIEAVGYRLLKEAARVQAMRESEEA